jgi:hypothetical protein
MAHVPRLPDPFNQSIAISGRVRPALALLVAGLLAPGASAADPFYLGAWKIASAVVAPWADPARPDPAEMKSLVGKTVTIQPKAIIGPKILACQGPNYRVRDVPADWLFQGAFGEMHDRNKSADPVKVAATLGFHGSSWKTLETGCANELDFHFVDATTAEFGLNDFVYTLRKQ